MKFVTINFDGEDFRLREIDYGLVGELSFAYRLMLGDDDADMVNGIDDNIVYWVSAEELETLSDVELSKIVAVGRGWSLS